MRDLSLRQEPPLSKLAGHPFFYLILRHRLTPLVFILLRSKIFTIVVVTTESHIAKVPILLLGTQDLYLLSSSNFLVARRSYNH